MPPNYNFSLNDSFIIKIARTLLFFNSGQTERKEYFCIMFRKTDRCHLQNFNTLSFGLCLSTVHIFLSFWEFC